MAAEAVPRQSASPADFRSSLRARALRKVLRGRRDAAARAASLAGASTVLEGLLVHQSGAALAGQLSARCAAQPRLHRGPRAKDVGTRFASEASGFRCGGPQPSCGFSHSLAKSPRAPPTQMQPRRDTIASRRAPPPPGVDLVSACTGATVVAKPTATCEASCEFDVEEII